MRFLVFIGLLFSQISAFAWSERGHHLIGYTAAYAVDAWVSKEDKALIGDAFTSRAHMMGHLNNIPDVSWKAVKNKQVLSMNRPTHYFDPELLYPKQSFEKTTEMISSLPTSWAELEKMQKNRKDPYSGSKLDLYNDVGSAPWRVQDLYQKMVSAFACAKMKQGQKEKKFKDRKTMMKMDGEKIVKDIKCKDDISVEHALLAAFSIGGTMGHFVADLAQPLHNTIDFDGFVNGQGGLHAYFESDYIRDLPLSLEGDVQKQLQNQKFRNNLEKEYKLKSSPNVAQLMFFHSQNSRSQYNYMLGLDKKFSLLQEGTKVAFGIRPDKSSKKAERKNSADLLKYKELAEFAKLRLATGAYALSYLWHRAWIESGKPQLAGIDKEDTVYPMDVGFIKPDYAH